MEGGNKIAPTSFEVSTVLSNHSIINIKIEELYQSQAYGPGQLPITHLLFNPR